MKTVDAITEIGLTALLTAHNTVKMLGQDGKTIVKNPQHRFINDDSAIFKGDVETEKAVLSSFQDAQFGVKVISEEHGETDIDLPPMPEYLAILDGIDGSKAYQEGQPGYATILAIFDGLNPLHQEYIFSGIMDHHSGILFFAVKGKGARFFRIGAVRDAAVRELHTSEKTALDENVRVFLHRRIECFGDKLKSFQCTPLTCCALAFVEILEGKSHLIAEMARKDNLEQAAAFGLVAEAGGVIMTEDGKSIGQKRYFDLIAEKNRMLVTAANEALAHNFLKHVGLEGGTHDSR